MAAVAVARLQACSRALDDGFDVYIAEKMTLRKSSRLQAKQGQDYKRCVGGCRGGQAGYPQQGTGVVVVGGSSPLVLAWSVGGSSRVLPWLSCCALLGTLGGGGRGGVV